MKIKLFKFSDGLFSVFEAEVNSFLQDHKVWNIEMQTAGGNGFGFSVWLLVIYEE